MEKIKIVKINLDAEERKILGKAQDLLSEIIEECYGDDDLDYLKELCANAFEAIEEVKEETDH